MGKTKKPDPPPDSRQVNFRADLDLYGRLEATAQGLGIDVSNLVRMVLNENLHAYEDRAEQAQARKRKP